MKLYSLLRRISLATLAVFVLLAATLSLSAADEHWTRVTSSHFLLAGNVTEAELREIAGRLEQFRAALSRLSFNGMMETEKPTIVLVFRRQSDYAPVSPLLGGEHSTGVVGHFQWSPEVNFIAFSAESQGERGASSVAVHEYVHAVVRNSFGSAPVWLDEGLSEYYSTSEFSADGRKALLGRAIGSHALYLREHAMMPLERLLAVEHNSPEYLDHERRPLFYAESWALVHYLLNRNGGRRKAELAEFLDLQWSGLSLEARVRQAFHMGLRQLEEEFSTYVRASGYPEETRLLERREDVPGEAPRGVALARAEAAGYEGMMLIRAERFEEAERQLQKALAAKPDLTMVRTGLGLLRLEQNAYVEAREHLKRAIALDEQNFLAHLYYAELLSRDGEETDKTVAGYILKTALIRAELKRVIELRPDFAESYRRLAEVDLQRSPRLDETQALLDRADKLWPGRDDFALLRARLYLRRGETAHARELLDRLGLRSFNPRTIAQAQNLLKAVADYEEYMTAQRASGAGEEARSEAEWWAAMQPCDMPEPGPQIKRLRFAGQQVCGRLERIECEEKGSILSVEAQGRTLKFYSDDLTRIRFVNYTAGIGLRVECGERSPASQVLLTYRSAKSQSEMAGEVIAVEFVPSDWIH
jgi:tetratricopeptide (TPR) repeat protein